MNKKVKEVVLATILKSKRNGRLEVAPDYYDDRVVFHPIPKSLQTRYHAGQQVEGYVGQEHPTEKFDRTKKRIVVAYFIPTGVNGNV